MIDYAYDPKIAGMVREQSMPITRARKCWWCGKKLAAISHATVEAMGSKYLVHKVCEEATRRYFKPVTAQPSIRTKS